MESATERGPKGIVIDGMMHLEVNGNTWEGLVDEVIEYYDCVGIDKGVVLTTWMPSRESNDRTLRHIRNTPTAPSRSGM